VQRSTLGAIFGADLVAALDAVEATLEPARRASAPVVLRVGAARR